MAEFIKYLKSTGQIVSKGSCSPDTLLPLQADDECGVIEGKYDPATQYYDLETHVITLRPAMPTIIDKAEIVADETDFATISGLPVDTQVIIRGLGEWVVLDGVFSFTVDLPGEYTIKCINFPYQDKEFIVDAREPEIPE